ncbi:heparin lyase I family protein [Pedobacter sp. MC2016-05]|uniref:heparin lyase I family protein n=1 Tax=Pedobacter sp. MC2016-05 TaxID=2994474 RepID=UPI0022461549|nr:heparin lyase I family protein [Pedobacter sp. MC2016-05]MCX2477011.1 heparin lyase I family protein [Pedobacter sp. MC2016-05]
MNSRPFLILASFALFFTACKKSTSQELIIEEKQPSAQVLAVAEPTNSNVLLDLTYENGKKNSGVANLDTSKAAASDASYIVQPGSTGNWAVAHKVVQGDPNYYSNENYRSESSTVNYTPGRFFPGDVRRYEFSVLLKDWQFIGTDPTESNIFQLKLSAGEVPLQIRTTRNAMVLRFAKINAVPNVTAIADARPYVNQWIHFRIDVDWQDTATGYMKTYMKLPNQTEYLLIDDKNSYLTYPPNGSSGQIGYIKWGVYIAPVGQTRIAYHDNIRIIKLN